MKKAGIFIIIVTASGFLPVDIRIANISPGRIATKQAAQQSAPSLRGTTLRSNGVTKQTAQRAYTYVSKLSQKKDISKRLTRFLHVQFASSQSRLSAGKAPRNDVMSRKLLAMM